MAFPGPGAGQLDHLIIRVGQVQAEAHGTVQLQGPRAIIANLRMAGNGRKIPEHRVIQRHPDPGTPVS